MNGPDENISRGSARKPGEGGAPDGPRHDHCEDVADDAGGGIPDDVVDRFFDGELDEGARRAFLRSLPSDLDRCEEVAKTRRMLDMLGSGRTVAHAAPDLTGKIIAAVDERRGFASRHVRRLARAARLGLAAAVVLVVGAVAAVERVAPDATRLAPAPAPLTSAVRETQAEFASTLGSLTLTLDSLQTRVGQGVNASVVRWHGRGDGHGSHDGSDGAGGAGVERRVVVVERSTPAAPSRVVSVSFALSAKAEPSAMTWTMDMAPRGVPGGCPGRMVDAEGRSAAFNMPMGIWRGDGDAQGPYVLPGREMSIVRVRAGTFAPLGRGSIGP